MYSDEELLQKAKDVMKNAYCAYSNFQVGAALVTKDGQLFLGANHENASFGGTICAERSAFVAALTAGHREFTTIAVAHAPSEPASPCGICRQFMVEFGDMKVILGSSTSSKVTVTTLYELLPGAFTPKSLHSQGKVISTDLCRGSCQ